MGVRLEIIRDSGIGALIITYTILGGPDIIIIE